MNGDNRPKILIISDATWSDDNNIGNTFSNLFRDWPKDKIGMIYARSDLPNTDICDEFFQISESRLIKRFFNFNIKTGKNIKNISLKKIEKKNIEMDEVSGKNLYNFFLKYRWNIFLTAREILWKVGNWKTKELDGFIDDFSPEIVLSLGCPNEYMNNLQQYVITKSRAKSIIYFVDDVYSSKRFNLSPIFWFNRRLRRREIRKTVSMCDLVYTIIDKQKKEYDDLFGVNSKILNKGGNFLNKLIIKKNLSTPIKIVYTGNITSGRWRTLVKIGEALDKINKNKIKAILEIYTKNELYGKIEKAFEKIASVEFKGGLNVEQVKDIQNSADILLHVESIKLKEKLETRLSFSTKIVDYFERGKCILAIGWAESASIEYIKKNQAGFVIEDVSNIEVELGKLINNPELIRDYGNKGRNCGFNHHQINKIKESMLHDFKNLLTH